MATQNAVTAVQLVYSGARTSAARSRDVAKRTSRPNWGGIVPRLLLAGSGHDWVAHDVPLHRDAAVLRPMPTKSGGWGLLAASGDPTAAVAMSDRHRTWAAAR